MVADLTGCCCWRGGRWVGGRGGCGCSTRATSESSLPRMPPPPLSPPGVGRMPRLGDRVAKAAARVGD